MDTNMVLYLPFDDPEGSKAYDFSQYRHCLPCRLQPWAIHNHLAHTPTPSRFVAQFLDCCTQINFHIIHFWYKVSKLILNINQKYMI